MNILNSLNGKLVLALLSSSALSSLASAAPATDDGARAIEKSFAQYLGNSAVDSKILSVSPKGDAYQINLDFEKLAGNFGGNGLELKMAPVTFLTSEQADGTWSMKLDGIPDLSLKMPSPEGGITEDFKYKNFKYEGVFNPKLMAIMSGKVSSDSGEGMVSGKTSGTVSIGAMVADIANSDAGNGAVSGKMHQTMQGLTENLKVALPVKEGSPAAATDVAVRIGNIVADMDVDSFKSKALFDLLALFQANPSKNAWVAKQDDVKAKLAATLPLWNNMKGSFTGHDISITTPQGTFGAKSFGEMFAMTGATEHGAIEFGFNFADLSLPAGLVPAIDAPLVPTSIDLDIKVTMDGLDHVAKTLIEEADFGNDKPLPDSAKAELAGIAMTGNPKIVIAPSHIVAPGMNLTIAGEVASNGLNPTGKITVDVVGLDKTLDALKAASKSDPKGQQAVAGLSMMKGLARPGANGASTFVIEINGKTVSINGMAIPMGGK